MPSSEAQATGGAGDTAGAATQIPPGSSPRHFLAKMPIVHPPEGESSDLARLPSELLDGFLWHFEQAARMPSSSASRRACSGGAKPCSAAQETFSRIVKQQHAPAQHCSEVAQPQGWSWQGNGMDDRLPTGEPRSAGMGAPTAANR